MLEEVLGVGFGIGIETEGVKKVVLLLSIE